LRRGQFGADQSEFESMISAGCGVWSWVSVLDPDACRGTALT
jgi:hypothetical protein